MTNDPMLSDAGRTLVTDLGVVPLANSPAEFGNYIVQYTEKWGKVIRAANIKPE